MKIINLQDYQKDKGIELFRLKLNEMPIDDNLKMLFNGMLDLDLTNFNVLKNILNEFRSLNETIAITAETIKKHSESLDVDIPDYMKKVNALLNAQSDSLMSTGQNFVKFVEIYYKDMEDLKNRINTLEGKIK